MIGCASRGRRCAPPWLSFPWEAFSMRLSAVRRALVRPSSTRLFTSATSRRPRSRSLGTSHQSDPCGRRARRAGLRRFVCAHAARRLSFRLRLFAFRGSGVEVTQKRAAKNSVARLSERHGTRQLFSCGRQATYIHVYPHTRTLTDIQGYIRAHTHSYTDVQT